MKQDGVLQILKQKNAEMTKQFGVKSLLLFGSVARNEATPASDVDLLVEFNRPVDLGTPDSLKPYIEDRVMGN